MERLVYVEGRTLPEAWERSIYELWRRGRRVWSEYNQYTVDAPAMIVVRNPLAEPRVHLKGCVVGFKGLREYVEEILEGTNDWRIGKDWHYTYHERIFAYVPPVYDRRERRVVNQVDYVIKKLKEAPYTRRAVVVTWQPWKDEWADSPPCLICLWFRVIDDRLEAHAIMRSNDALKAAFVNMFAFTEVQRVVAEEVGFEVGRYIHFADSYHIYERDWRWAEKFIEQIEGGESSKYWLPSERLGI